MVMAALEDVAGTWSSFLMGSEGWEEELQTFLSPLWITECMDWDKLRLRVELEGLQILISLPAWNVIAGVSSLGTSGEEGNV